MIIRQQIKDLLKSSAFDTEVRVMGWVRTFRNNQFIALNDGSCMGNIQVVVDFNNTPEYLLKRITTGAAVSIVGKLVESQGKGQTVEIKATNVDILGDSDPEKFPLQPKKHSLEFLREIAHLRFRTNTFNAVFKVRHALAFAIHQFYNKKGFVYMHTPIITASDAEGAGEMFKVTTLDLLDVPYKSRKFENGSLEYYSELVKFITSRIKRDYISEINGLLMNNDLIRNFKDLIISDLEKLFKESINPKIRIDCGRVILELHDELIKKNFFQTVQTESKKTGEIKDRLRLPEWFVKLINQTRKGISAKAKESDANLFSLSFYNFSYVHKELKSVNDRLVDFSEDFFGRATNLTVSGQLEGELAAMAFGQIYTFGPTFRAENSNTTRHLAEFWMIEPEIAFADLENNMQLAEEMMKYVIKYAKENCKEELAFLDNRLAEEEKQKPQNERSELTLLEKLDFCLSNDFERLTYTEAIEILKASKPNQKKQFKYLIDAWGVDLQSEHERYLVEKHFKKPVILTDYPKDIKSFYMRLNDDGKTVAAMDILFPGIGEMIGGSQREERMDMLTKRMEEMNIPQEELWWYLDTRRFGSAPHAGFGLGFERLVLFVTGMTNIRDVIAFPRFPNSAEF